MIVAFVVRLPEGEMLSHVVLPVTPFAVAVNGVALVAVTDKVWDAGALPEAVALNVNEAGLAVSGLDAPGFFIASVTGIVVVLPLDVM